MSTPPPIGSALGERIADFLRRYPPFSYLPLPDLQLLATEVVVHYLPPQAIVFAQDDEPLAEFFVVRKGAIRLSKTEEGVLRLVDQLDEGDMFGLRPLLAKRPYLSLALASEESLLYGVPLSAFEPLIDQYPAIGRFLATSFASPVGADVTVAPSGYAPALNDNGARLSTDAFRRRRDGLPDATRVGIRGKPVTCTPNTSVQQVAVLMSGESVGSIVVVDDGQRPVGIITDQDLRRHVVAGNIAKDAPARAVMSQPVVTIAPDPRAVDVQLAMVRARVRHLVVTADGSTRAPVVGMLSQRDLVLALGSSPAAVVAQIATAADPRELLRLRERAEQWLRELVASRGSVYEAADIMAEVNDELTRRCIALARAKLVAEGVDRPPLGYCWMSLGSQGRREQLVRTDQDHAIVIADGSPADHATSLKYYVRLAVITTDYLEQVGYDRCIGEMMAANPEWCLTLKQWSQKLDEWIRTPSGSNLLATATLLDRRPIEGNLELGEKLGAMTRNRARGEALLLALLARAAVDNPPPLSFFRNFVVERSGEHKDEFDIKQRAMLPLADAARVLSLQLGTSDPPNTIERFDRLRAAEPQNAELYLAGAQAYDTLMAFRARQGLADGSEGRYFRISELSKLDRLQLRNTFGPVADLLAALKVRFQLKALTP